MAHTPCNASIFESAFQRFPTEVLGEVFAQALDDDATDPSQETMKQLIDICLVCREWCGAARITHSLWRSLSLPGTLTSRAFEKARRWLDRAGTLPKSLAVVATACHSGHCRDRTGCSLASWELATILMDGTMDFYHLAITCRSSVCFYQLLTLFEEVRRRDPIRERPRPWENVKSLSFDFFDDWNQWEDFQDPNQDVLTSVTYPIFVLLPPVTSLSLRLPSISNDSSAAEWAALNVPEDRLANLTELTLKCDWWPRKILKVLEGCHNVERLTLDLNDSVFLGGYPCAGFDDKTALLPKVRKLHIQNLNRGALGYLRHFRMPLLEELSLEFTEVGSSKRLYRGQCRPMEEVVYLFQRSQCAETLLSVHLHNSSAIDLQHLQIRLPFMAPPRFRASKISLAPNSWALSRAGV